MQIFFTDARTFISTPSFPALLVAIHNPPARQIVGRKLHGHAVTRKNANEILPHFSRDMGQHLMLVLELHSKHGVRKRLDYGRHHFNGVFFPAFARLLVAVLDRPSSHVLLSVRSCYQTGPAASRGRVKIQGPFAVTATVCSKWAESLPSVVTAVQSSARIFTPGPPRFTIGSIARTIPSCSRCPCPGVP